MANNQRAYIGNHSDKSSPALTTKFQHGLPGNCTVVNLATYAVGGRITQIGNESYLAGMFQAN